MDATTKNNTGDTNMTTTPDHNAVTDAEECKHVTRFFSRTCAAKICSECDDHEGLDRCWCGWSKTGGNGYTELSEMGETMEAEDY